jgi:hypothetical protein
MNTFNLQLHIGSEKPAADLMQPIRQDLTAALNKARGGIWTSTFLGKDLGSDWAQWQIENDYVKNIANGYSGETEKSWLLTPAKDANVFVIDHYKDLEDLMRKYQRPLYEMSKMYVPDYVKIMQDFDAIHLTKRGEAQTRYSQPFSLYGWDCESTFWLKWKFEKVEDIGEITYKDIQEKTGG